MIRFSDVTKVYDNGTKALTGVNFEIEAGEFVFFVGHSGSGKSTLVKLMMCEERPTAGEVVVNGYRISKIKHVKIPFLRRTMGVVFQDFRLIGTKTVYENVAFAMRAVGAPMRDIRKRVPYVLGLVGLAHKAKAYPTQLSGGEQQRVALARAIVNNPSVLVADEPTGNLDPHMSFEIMQLLKQINNRGTTVIVVTHEKGLVDAMKKRVIMMDGGTVASDRTGGYSNDG
jgi:cell division transport system ATP-binding protein